MSGIIEMKVSASKGQSTSRRSNMKRRMITGVIGAIALVVTASIVAGLSGFGGANSVSNAAGRAEDVKSALPNESFAHFSIDGTNVTTHNPARVTEVEPRLPLESFSYWSIDGVTSVAYDVSKR